MTETDKRDPSRFRRADDATRVTSESAQLAEAAMALLGCRTPEDVYGVIGDFMTRLCPGVVIVVNEVTPGFDFFLTRKVFGVEHPLVAKIVDLVGFDVVGKRWAIPAPFKSVVLHGTLSRIDQGFAAMTGRDIPKPLASAITKAFSICDLYVVGIADGKHAFGNFAILTRAPNVILPAHLIESFAHHCYSALDGIARARELSESAEESRAIISCSPVPTAVNDEQQRITFVNAAFTSTFGYTMEDTPTLTEWWLKAYPDPEYRLFVSESWKAELARAASTGTSFSPMQVTVRCADGTAKTVMASAASLSGSFAGSHLVVLYDITEQERALADLSLSEAKFSAAFRTSPDAVTINRLSDGLYVDINEGFERLTGYTPADVDGKLSREIDIWADPTDRARLVAGLLEGGSVENLEARFRRKDGALSTGLMSARVIDIGGEPHILAITRDISERTRAEEALRASEARFRVLFESASDGIFMMSPEGDLVSVNEAFARMHGYTVEEMLALGITDLDTPETAGLTAARLPQVLAGESMTFEVEHFRKDGSVLPLEVATNLVAVGAGRYILAFHRDISVRRQAEAALQQSEARLDLALESAAMGVWSYDIAQDRRFFDGRVCRLLGLDPSTFTGSEEQYFAAIHPDDLASVKAKLGRTMELDEPYEPEYRAVWPDGSVHWITGRGTLVRDPEGRPKQINGILWDNTERKGLEAAMQRRLVALTQPPSAGGLTFSDLFDIDEIQSIQDAFSKATGVASIITEPDGTPITRPSNFCRLCSEVIRGTEKGRANCFKSDADLGCYSASGPSIQVCESGGLWDAGASISAGGEHVANWLVGQVRNERQDAASMLAYADEIGADREEFAAALAEVPVMTLERFELVAEALFAVANELSVVAYQNVQQARLITERQQMEEARTHDLERLTKALWSTVEIVGQVVETRDPYTAGHQRRVSELSVRIAEEMGMTTPEVGEIRTAALLHDVGKMAVPAEILSKPGALSTVEFELIKCHSDTGRQIIASADMEGPTAEIVHQHHERCDGSGYPRGLKADELLPAAKVIMVADVVEAMMSHRPYRPALGQDLALAEIAAGAGTLYDPDVYRACAAAFGAGFEFSKA